MDLSVVIVSFNTQKLLRECLTSLFQKTKGITFEVIVVDNASSDGSVVMVQKNFPQVILLQNRKNLGFAAANNLGLKKAKGKFLLLLNSDTKLLEDCLTKMVTFMKENEKIGIATCQLLGRDGKVQASGGFFPTLSRVFAWMFFLDDLPLVSFFVKPFHPHTPSFYLRQDWYQKAHDQDWVTGAFFLMRREVWEKIGFLDEKFFMYVEEMEYCFRAKKAGFKVYYTPETKIIHLGGGSGSSQGAIVSEFRGLKYFFQKHFRGWQVTLALFLLKGGAALRYLIFGIIKGEKVKRQAYVQVIKEI